MSAAVDSVRNRAAMVATSEIVRTIVWLTTGIDGPSGSHMPPLADHIRRTCRDDDVAAAFYVLCHELDMRIPVR